ncbi:beta-ketoacyl synthase N-terminal-like domain-containing protein [Buchnera aphidicola]|uniref:beta-ketoacyl synthase N-terminal-like domain-containing protein n=1 Tax=Buchnera aphidicola TaxID=9 RepID=UPI0030EF25ED
MKRVVITGLGIISSIGNNKLEVEKSLKNSISGISFSKEMKNFGLKSNVWAPIKNNFSKKLFHDLKMLKYMNFSSFYAYISMMEAIQDAFLKNFQYKKNSNIGVIVGSGCGYLNFEKLFFNSKDNIIQSKNFKKIKLDPYLLFKTMPSNISACLSTIFKIYGTTYSMSSACATSSHCIGHAYELIRSGKQNIIFSGGSEELNVNLACFFDILGVLSKKFNFSPKESSRPYDINRDGFVISSGSGILVLEEMNHALSRNARIYAEIIGYGTSSDGHSMFFPSKKGVLRCMKNALKQIFYHKHKIDYINTHGTSTKIGDLNELKAILKIFKKRDLKKILISSTKSITGHSLGASGVHAIINTILMFQNNFVAPNQNIVKLDKFSKNINLIQKKKDVSINIAMINNFGFGGTNASLILKKF